MTVLIRNKAYVDKDVAVLAGQSPGGTNLPQDRANQEATDWDAIIAQRGNYRLGETNSRFPGMLAANPALAMFVYMNTAFYPNTCDRPAAEYFKTCSGVPGITPNSFIKSAGFRNFLMRVDQSAWRTNRANVGVDLATLEPGLAGDFMDTAGVQGVVNVVQANNVANCGANPTNGPDYTPGTCGPHTPYTVTQWLGFTSDTVAAVVAALAALATPKLVVANGLNTNDDGRYDATKQLWESDCEAAMNEQFLRQSNDGLLQFRSETQWLRDITKTLGPIQGGPLDGQTRNAWPMTKIGAGVTGNGPAATVAATFERWRVYAMASLLVGTDGGDDRLACQFDANDNAYDSMIPPAWYEMEIGDPVGARITSSAQKVSNVYAREYTKGWALVNPTTDGGSFVVPAGSFVDTDGNPQSGTISVPANTGVILFDTATPPPVDNEPPKFAAGDHIDYYISPGQIDLVAPLATDNVGVDFYRWTRTGGGGGAVVTDVGPTGSHVLLSDNTVVGGSVYAYELVAYDAAGNASNALTVFLTAGATPGASEMGFGPHHI